MAIGEMFYNRQSCLEIGMLVDLLKVVLLAFKWVNLYEFSLHKCIIRNNWNFKNFSTLVKTFRNWPLRKDGLVRSTKSSPCLSLLKA